MSIEYRVNTKGINDAKMEDLERVEFVGISER
jgi:hypothetical protein